MIALGRMLSVALLIAACGDAQPSSAPGSSSPTTAGPGATPGAPASTPMAAPDLPPTSVDLIKAARAAGRIDEDTALLYRVYAVFGAPALPAEYRSPRWTEDAGVLDLAQERLDALPPDVAERIRPFVVRPTSPASAFFAGEQTAGLRLASVRTSALTAAVPCGANGWASIDGVSHFKVWGRCGGGFDNSDLEFVAGLLDTLWTDESTYMGRQPRLDAGGPDEGGDDRVDVYLVGNCVTRDGACQTHRGLACARSAPTYAGSSGAVMASGYIIINRAWIGDPEMPATVAHELFHVLQFAFNADGGDGAELHWFYEAAATWAEFRFVGDPTSTRRRFLEYQGTNRPLQDVADENAYRSFVWPLFMEEEAGAGTVAEAWADIEGVTTSTGITDAIDGRLPFKTHFRDFAVRDWNDEDMAAVIGPMLPAGAVGSLRIQPYTPRRGADEILRPNPAGTVPSPFPVGMQSLAAWFELLPVDNAVGQITLDFSGLQPRAAIDIDLLVYVQGLGWDRRQVVNDRITFCRNVPADKVTEIVVVLSNHDKDPVSNVQGVWTAESLEDPCPVGMTGNLTAEVLDVYVDPTGAEHPISGTLRVHLVIEIGPYGSLYAALGSTYSYEMHYSPLFACGAGVVMDSGGLAPRKGQGPYDNADPNATGTATIGGGGEGPGAELGVDISIPPPASACQGGWIGTFGFVRDPAGTYVHDVPRTRFDKFDGYHEDESHGTIVGGP